MESSAAKEPSRTAPAYDAVMGPSERGAGGRSSDPRLTAGDLLVMADLLARERALARTWPRAAPGPDIGEWSEGESRQLLAVPHGDALLDAFDVTAVGFFGELRAGVDHTILFALEREVAATFPDFARFGFLSYFDVGPQHGRYGNLVLFTAAGVPEAWHANPAHRRARAVAPEHYEHIRLHEGRIPDLSSGTVRCSSSARSTLTSRASARGARCAATAATPQARRPSAT